MNKIINSNIYVKYFYDNIRVNNTPEQAEKEVTPIFYKTDNFSNIIVSFTYMGFFIDVIFSNSEIQKEYAEYLENLEGELNNTDINTKNFYNWFNDKYMDSRGIKTL